ncbi:hypothetical protein LguiB_015628 [Lonicera macranthoides]
MEELSKTRWFQEPEDELISAFFDDESPFFMTPSERVSVPQSSPLDGSSINRLISNLYSGPTIEDIESSLSMTSYVDHSQDLSHQRISMLGRGNLSKGESKYTLKIRSYGNVMADDGYKWRKYGQKSIKNSPNPSAKKQVERSNNDPDTLVITYEGLHLHYAYPFFQPEAVDQPFKKSKRSSSEVQAQELKGGEQISQPNYDLVDHHQQQQQQQQEEEDLEPNEVMGSQGLLEDIVPLIIRKPIVNTSNSSSSSSYPSSPPTSPLSFSWSPHYSPLCFN